jgi:hypothetical protein
MFRKQMLKVKGNVPSSACLPPPFQTSVVSDEDIHEQIPDP